MLCDRVLVLRRGTVAALAPTQDAITAYANLVQEARVAEIGGHDVTIACCDAGTGSAVTEVDAGARVAVKVKALPPPGGAKHHAELQIRHLESGTVIYRCLSQAAGAPAVASASGGVEVNWMFTANLGRGHYGVMCAILNEQNRWVATSSSALLTVNERQSEHAMVFLETICRMAPVGVGAEIRT
jgi:hypothetical protein